MLLKKMSFKNSKIIKKEKYMKLKKIRIKITIVKYLILG